jgi:hypothetical protein
MYFADVGNENGMRVCICKSLCVLVCRNRAVPWVMDGTALLYNRSCVRAVLCVLFVLHGMMHGLCWLLVA